MTPTEEPRGLNVLPNRYLPNDPIVELLRDIIHVREADLVRYSFGGGDVPFRAAIHDHLEICLDCRDRFKAERRRQEDDMRVTRPERKEVRTP